MAEVKKRRFRVFARQWMEAEEPEDCYEGKWELVGETWAVSEDKAVNNVRFRTLGKVSQYLPIATGGHWEKGLDWKAEEAK